MDPKLLEVERFGVDPASRDAIISAQIESRNAEGSTADRSAATYVLKFVVSVHYAMLTPSLLDCIEWLLQDLVRERHPMMKHVWAVREWSHLEM